MPLSVESAMQCSIAAVPLHYLPSTNHRRIIEPTAETPGQNTIFWIAELRSAIPGAGFVRE